MSFKFIGSGNECEGDFASAYPTTPSAIWAFVKLFDHPLSIQSIVQAGLADGSNSDTIEMRMSATLNTYSGRVVSTGGTANLVDSVAVNIAGSWTPIVCEFLSDISRTIRVRDYSTNTGISTADRTLGNMQHIKCGRTFTNGNAWGSAAPNEDRLAEVAIFTGAIPSQAETELYMVNQQRPSAITFASAVMSLYISMETNTLENTGADAGGDLAATGATFDADHPIMTAGGVHAYPLYGKFGGLLRGKLG